MRSPLRHRPLIASFWLLVLTLSGLGTVAAREKQVTALSPQPPPQATFHAPDPAARAIVIRSEPASYELPMRDAATEMQASASCSRFEPRGIDVSLRWSSRRTGTTAYRVDITEFGDGFAKGRYLTSGERETSVKELPFEEALPGTYYYWRLLTKTADGWVVSGTGRFDAPICPADDEEEER